MTAEEALKLVELADNLVFAKTGENLSDIQKAIIQQTLEGIKLKDIKITGYENSSIQRHYAYKLWKLLERVTGEKKVGVKNLQVVIERLQKLELPKVADTVTAKGNETEGENSQISEVLESSTDNNIYTLSESNFVGRDTAINDINNLVNERHKIIVIQAAGGVGKTTLAKQYLYQNFDLVLPLEMAKDTENITAVETEVETWLKQYFQEEPGRDFKNTLTRLKQQLKNRKVGVLIDNLEPALDKQGRFIEKHNLYVELLRVLADKNVQSITLITSRERLCDERVNGISHYPLSVLDVTAWAEFFTSRKIKIDIPSLEAMHKIYGGNAKAMDIILGVMRTDYDGDMSAYWQDNHTLVETELKNLVESQFKRLQTLDTEAYKLLCRLGCFRYQDVPRVSIDALLALLWDIHEDKRRDVIKSLRNRCLVEFEKGEYWLHPVIREQGIERLKASGEWEEVNRKAAEFWTTSDLELDSFKNCIIIFESFYYYCSIYDWYQAFKILEKQISLGGSRVKLREQIRRYGCSHYLIDSLNQLQGKLLDPADEGQRVGAIGVSFYYMSQYKKAIKYLQKCEELYENISLYYHSYAQIWLAKSYKELGQLDLAIDYCNKALETSEKLINLNKENGGCKYMTLNTIGSIYMVLGEYKIAIQNHENAIKSSHFSDSLYKRHKGDALGYIAYCKYAIGEYKEAIDSCNESVKIFQEVQDYISECIAMCWLCEFYLYIGKNDLATETLEFAKKISQQVKFLDPQLKTMLLNTEAIFLVKTKANYEKAISLYHSSIQLNKSIGAKFDHANTSYHLAVTYQKMGETENSNINFNEAIRLFNEMEAPKQVEKVEKAKRDNID